MLVCVVTLEYSYTNSFRIEIDFKRAFFPLKNHCAMFKDDGVHSVV